MSSRVNRIEVIQALSREEGTRQPAAHDWLAEQDAKAQARRDRDRGERPDRDYKEIEDCPSRVHPPNIEALGRAFAPWWYAADRDRAAWAHSSFHDGVSGTTNKTDELFAETSAINAQTTLLTAKAEAARRAVPPLEDRPWFPWAALPIAVLVGMGSTALSLWIT